MHSNLWKWGVSRNSNLYTWWSNLLHTAKGYHGNIHEACRSKCNGDIFGLRRTSVCYENFICGISDGIITCAIISWIKYKHMCERDDTCDSIHAKGHWNRDSCKIISLFSCIFWGDEYLCDIIFRPSNSIGCHAAHMWNIIIFHR